MAACVAEAFRPGASVESVVAVALDLAKEGTHDAIAATVAAARGCADWRQAIPVLRDAIRPFDGSAEDGVRDRGNGTDDWGPSRLKSIEEVPVALGFLVVAGGEFEPAVFGAANYGRDNDSIAGMAGAIAGALHGDGAIRREWIARIDEANRVDLDPLAEGSRGWPSIYSSCRSPRRRSGRWCSGSWRGRPWVDPDGDRLTPEAIA
jgi:hypothetical protein